jgi:hypothetical protein
MFSDRNVKSGREIICREDMEEDRDEDGEKVEGGGGGLDGSILCFCSCFIMGQHTGTRCSASWTGLAWKRSTQASFTGHCVKWKTRSW